MKKPKPLQSIIDRLTLPDFYPDKQHAKMVHEFREGVIAESNGDIDEAYRIYMSVLERYKPEGTLYWERPAIMLEKAKRPNEALNYCMYALSVMHDEYKHVIEIRLDRLEKKSKVNPFNRGRNTKPQPQHSIKPTNTHSSNVSTSSNLAHHLDDLGDWYVSISFGKSRSSNFTKALALAKSAPKYIESSDEQGNDIYQAIYSPEPKEYLAFIALYELVSNRKSSFVIINGSIVDRKIIQGLNYCYGDKCRSSNPSFCYGARIFTENPFGCHRLQVSSFNHPWWTYGSFDTSGIWHVDKPPIIERIKERASMYELCPVFSWDRVLNGIESLPVTIDPNSDRRWRTCTHQVDGKLIEGVCPSDHQRMPTYTIRFEQKSDIEKEPTQPKRAKARNNIPQQNYCISDTRQWPHLGCLIYSIITIIVALIIAFN